jgi:hypothetical protein
MAELTVDVECPRCGDQHRVILDRKGYFDCALPCEPETGERLVGRVDARAWMLLQEQLTKRIVH